MMKLRLHLPRISRLSFLAVILMVGLGMVGCSEDEPIAPEVPDPEPPVFGTIKIFSDDTGASCNISGNPSGVETVYLFHTDHQGVTGSQFRIETSGTGFVWIADQTQPRTLEIGNTEVGSSFAYGLCVGTDYHFATVAYQCDGSANPCSSLRIVADDAAGDIFAVSCADEKSFANGSNLTVNCVADDQCGGVVTSHSTWGGIESLNE